MYIDSDGVAHHYGYEEGTKKTILISTAGLPNMKGNFDGLLFAMRHMYGKNISYHLLCRGLALHESQYRGHNYSLLRESEAGRCRIQGSRTDIR